MGYLGSVIGSVYDVLCSILRGASLGVLDTHHDLPALTMVVHGSDAFVDIARASVRSVGSADAIGISRVTGCANDESTTTTL